MSAPKQPRASPEGRKKRGGMKAWWKTASRAEVIAGMRIELPDGTLAKRGHYAGMALEYERAAWIYEVEARLRQWKEMTKRPVYRFGKPFAALGMEQKNELRAQYPSKSWRPVPSVDDWPERGSLSAALFNELTLEWVKTKPGWIDFRISFNPAIYGRKPLHAAIDKFLDERMKALGVTKAHKSGAREKPYSWKILTAFDANPRTNDDSIRKFLRQKY